MYRGFAHVINTALTGLDFQSVDGRNISAILVQSAIKSSRYGEWGKWQIRSQTHAAFNIAYVF
jgi:hypothetical protein